MEDVTHMKLKLNKIVYFLKLILCICTTLIEFIQYVTLIEFIQYATLFKVPKCKTKSTKMCGI